MPVWVACRRCRRTYVTDLPADIVRRVARCEHCAGPLEHTPRDGTLEPGARVDALAQPVAADRGADRHAE